MLKKSELNVVLKKTVLCLSLLSIVSPVYADKVNVYFSGGPTFTRISNNTSVTLIDDVLVNDYKTNQKTRWQGFWGGGIAHTFEHVFNRPYHISLGLAGYSLYLGNVKGTEYPFSIPDIDTLNYQFNAQSAALMVESRLFFSCYKWQPFALVGIGNAWNHFSNYSEVPTDPAATAAALPVVFSSYTEDAFAFELGVGVKREFFRDMKHNIGYSGSLDYRYFNVGKGETGTFPADTAGGRLKVTNLYTQAITFSLTADLY